MTRHPKRTKSKQPDPAVTPRKTRSPAQRKRTGDTSSAPNAMRICIDTNWFLSFYEAGLGKAETQAVFEELTAAASLLIVPEQVIDEFHRNRLRLLRELTKRFEDSVTVRPYTIPLIKASDG